jgi:hypothetical protein
LTPSEFLVLTGHNIISNSAWTVCVKIYGKFLNQYEHGFEIKKVILTIDAVNPFFSMYVKGL